jgi:hypothetical protein
VDRYRGAGVAPIVDRGTCAGTARIFDGVRRYDLSYEDLGERELEDAEDFAGRARLAVPR